MGKHKLTDMRLAGSSVVLEILPDFDFYHLGKVMRLSLDPADEEGREFDLELEVEYLHGDRKCRVELLLSQVRMAKLPELNPSFSFGEVEIDDVSGDQLEGMRYRLHDYGMTQFEVLCRDIHITVKEGARALG